MKPLVYALVTDDSGQALTEYVILLGALSLSAIMAMWSIGVRVRDVFDRVARDLDQLAVY